MNILFVTFGNNNCPSTRYRIFQYLDLFRDAGHAINLLEYKDLSTQRYMSKFDIVVLQKKIPTFRATLAIKKISKNIIYDCDDVIWARPHKRYSLPTRLRTFLRIRFLMCFTKKCTCANSVIRDDLIKFGARKVVIIPMSVPNSLFSKKITTSGTTTIGWSGAPHNLPLLESILPSLLEIKREFSSKIRIIIHSGKDPSYNQLEYIFVPYFPENSMTTCASFDIGLTPLDNDYFSSGKSPIKSLIYMRDQCAVIASPYGAIKEIIQENVTGVFAKDIEQWTNRLRELILDRQLRTRIGIRGQAFQRKHHSLEIVGRKFIHAVTEE